jgi:hypothetical protein
VCDSKMVASMKSPERDTPRRRKSYFKDELCNTKNNGAK